MKVCYYPSNWDGAGCYRCFYPADQLTAQGDHKCFVGHHEIVQESERFLAIRFDLTEIPPADLYVIQNPGFKEFQSVYTHAAQTGSKVVVDLDDDYFHIPDYNPASKSTRGAVRSALAWCVRHADAVTVSTPSLKESIKEFTDAPVYVLRNFLDWRVWQHHDIHARRDWNKFRVGYMGVSHWHSGDIATLKSWFPSWIQANPGVEFVSAGDPSTPEILGVPLQQRVFTDSVSFRHQELADITATFDVGLVPLADNSFNQSKSHLKGMEYAGCGIPCIATPTESYHDWWLAGPDGGDGGAGFLAARPDEWIHALDRLSSDRDLLRRMGERARSLAEQHTIQKHWRLWENTYHEILDITIRKDTRRYTHHSGERVDAFGVRLVRS